VALALFSCALLVYILLDEDKKYEHLPLFVNEYFQFGMFGNPWEKSLCVFGKSLIAAFEENGAAIFKNLKDSLAGPLSGMGVAFSSSLFGLAGSLVVGFLDLQAGHAQNRFVNELEEWLSSSARISSGIIGDEGGAGSGCHGKSR